MPNYHLNGRVDVDILVGSHIQKRQEAQENHNSSSITNNRDTNQDTLLNLPINLQIHVTMPGVQLVSLHKKI